MSQLCRVQFWGTRGSLAKPGATTLRYGGNTACVEVRGADETLIVLDCGTGAHELGHSLTAAGEPRCDGHLMITHSSLLKSNVMAWTRDASPYIRPSRWNGLRTS